MTYRSYPSPDRARHQLDRHAHYEDVPVLVSPTAARLAQGLAAAFAPNYERVLESLNALIAAIPRAADYIPAGRPEGGSR